MKQQLLFLFITIFTINTFSQCPTGDVTLETQDEVEQFLIDFPNCTIISGDFEIGKEGGSDISDLSDLNNIASIVGDLYVYENPNLLDLSGLGGLTDSGDLYIYTNDILTNVNDLSNLASTGGYIQLWGNPELANLVGLEKITF